MAEITIEKYGYYSADNTSFFAQIPSAIRISYANGLSYIINANNLIINLDDSINYFSISTTNQQIYNFTIGDVINGTAYNNADSAHWDVVNIIYVY